MPRISVIVAVYKAENYLCRCIDSLLAQTFGDFEILLIDDGSPDQSGDICDEYARKNSRIRVFHKENGGVSSARQCGIDNAQGEYTIHVDPDDWVESTMLEDLFKKAMAEESDMVFCDFYKEYKDKTEYVNCKPVTLCTQQILTDLLLYKFPGTLCNKLIRLACYIENNIRLPEGLNYAEDWTTTIRLVKKIRKISYVPKAYYHYDQNANPASLTKSYSLEVYYQNKLRLGIIWDEIAPYVSSKVYNIQVINVAYEAFYKNVLSPSEYHVEFGPEIKRLLWNDASLKMKFCTVLSALGLKLIVYRLYCILKNIMRSKKCL